MKKNFIVYASNTLTIAISADYFEKYDDSIAFFNKSELEGKERVAVFNLHNIIGVTEG